jgi:hypothetical protein
MRHHGARRLPPKLIIRPIQELPADHFSHHHRKNGPKSDIVISICQYHTFSFISRSRSRCSPYRTYRTYRTSPPAVLFQTNAVRVVDVRRAIHRVLFVLNPGHDQQCSQKMHRLIVYEIVGRCKRSRCYSSWEDGERAISNLLLRRHITC